MNNERFLAGIEDLLTFINDKDNLLLKDKQEYELKRASILLELAQMMMWLPTNKLPERSIDTFLSKEDGDIVLVASALIGIGYSLVSEEEDK